jgi:raffinose/stachyose/melibiose transport system permease protein
MFLFTLPTVILYTIFFTVTVLLGIYYSFTNWNGISKAYGFVGLKNYFTVLTDPRFRHAIGFNIVYTVLVVGLMVVISMIIALALNSLTRLSTLFRSIYFIPAIISMVTVGLIWNELFYRAIPLVGKALGIGWLSSSLLGSPQTAMPAILLVNLWQGCAIPTVLLLAGLQSVPKDLYEAATIDGAGSWNKFKHVTIPYLIPVLNLIIITQTKAGLTVFDYIKVMTDGGPAQSTEAIGLLIFRHAINEGKFSRSVAESMILFVIVGIVAVLSLKLTNNKQVGE